MVLELRRGGGNAFRRDDIAAGFARDRNEDGKQEAGGEGTKAYRLGHFALWLGDDGHAGIAGAASADASAAVCARAAGGDCS